MDCRSVTWRHRRKTIKLQWKRPVRRWLYRSQNYENGDQYKYLEVEEDIDKDERAYLEKYIIWNDYNPANEVQDAPIQED